MPKLQKTGSRPRQQQKKEAKRLVRRRKKGRGDNFRRYLAVRTALKQFYPGEPSGNLARHLNTLAWMISGIVGSKRTNYPEIAKKCPDGNKPPSREKRFSRWVINDRVDFETYFAPFAVTLLLSLAHGPLVLAIDGSEVGRGCLALMVSVVYQGRALPLGWVVVKGNKGHFPEETHVALVQEVAQLTPPEADVIFLGDGEFDGLTLQQTVASYGWHYVCRTASDIVLTDEGDEFNCQQLELRPGELLSIPMVLFTRALYGPVHVIVWWAKDNKKPLFLVTNMELAQEACFWYKKRFRIETFFSDQKSRGFHLHKSHLDQPERLATLMIAACLAYIWMVYLGTFARHTGWDKIIHRTDRCDLSLFQLGLALLEHFLNESIPIPVAFQISLRLAGVPYPLPDHYW
jgi:Transposase DDE domain